MQVAGRDDGRGGGDRGDSKRDRDREDKLDLLEEHGGVQVRKNLRMKAREIGEVTWDTGEQQPSTRPFMSCPRPRCYHEYDGAYQINHHADVQIANICTALGSMLRASSHVGLRTTHGLWGT